MVFVLIAAHAFQLKDVTAGVVRSYASITLTQGAVMMARCVTILILAALALDVGELATAAVGGNFPVSTVIERYVSYLHYAYYSHASTRYKRWMYVCADMLAAGRLRIARYMSRMCRGASLRL